MEGVQRRASGRRRKPPSTMVRIRPLPCRVMHDVLRAVARVRLMHEAGGMDRTAPPIAAGSASVTPAGFTPNP